MTDGTNLLKRYILNEKTYLFVITLTGLIYNIGMVAGPWFEGQLAQMLCNMIGGTSTFTDMVKLAVTYVLVILMVQACRAFKRLYVRKFSNALNRQMKQTLYTSLVNTDVKTIHSENAGSLMTKAISDVDACAEGIRKFVTEIFDTGVVMIAYLVMLLKYDLKLSLIVLLFPPLAYITAEKLKVAVTSAASKSRKSADALNLETLDRASNAILYRVYGLDKKRSQRYETYLSDYEKKTVKANLLSGSLEPVYQVVSLIGMFFILWLGGRNVVGTGWRVWDIAAFSTYLACFAKLAKKSSKAAKLFNAVQKAKVSWTRIKPYLNECETNRRDVLEQALVMDVTNLSFAYDEDHPLFENVSFSMKKGQIIGITGPVACGKSTLGKCFLDELNPKGNITIDGENLSKLYEEKKIPVGYMGHDPELFSLTIRENILLGETGDCEFVLKDVCMDRDIAGFEDGLETRIGEGGVRLSGGQQARIALARTLYHKQPILVLDDPFSAVDKTTENQILEHLRKDYNDRMILLISHRLDIFDQLDGVLWMENGKTEFSTHDELMKNCETYRNLVELQGKAEDLDEKK